MVGLGTQDSLKLAQSFLKRNKIATVRLLWDKTGKSWATIGVPGQPAWMLIGTDGTVKRADLGAIPYQTVLDAI